MFRTSHLIQLVKLLILLAIVITVTSWMFAAL